MVNTNIKWNETGNIYIIKIIGQFIKHHRLKQNKTQTQIAKASGINRWTLSQIENGEAISLTSLIQILRTLDLLNIFNEFMIREEVSPIEMAKLEQKRRKRARNK